MLVPVLVDDPVPVPVPELSVAVPVAGSSSHPPTSLIVTVIS